MSEHRQASAGGAAQDPRGATPPPRHRSTLGPHPRLSRPVALTSAGHAFVAHARKVLNDPQLGTMAVRGVDHRLISVEDNCLVVPSGVRTASPGHPPRNMPRGCTVDVATSSSTVQEADLSPSRPAREGDDPQEPEQNRLDAEIEALISDYQELHKDDARLRRIERIIRTGHRLVDEEPEDCAGGIREEQIAPELRIQDLRQVAAGLLRTEADMRAYAVRFAQCSTEQDPAGRDLERQAHALDATGRHWLLMIGQNRDHGLVACRFVREKGIPHARMVSFTAERLSLPILVVELGPDENGSTAGR